jgi:outer membrane receptor protein involved in Fe transport
MKISSNPLFRRNVISLAIRTSYQIVIATAGAFLAGASYAQTATAEDTTAASTLDAVVVTGTASKKTKAQVSYSISTLDENTLRLNGATSVTETLKSVPGFWVESSGGEASGNIRARGIPVDGFGSVTLLEDGLPVQHDPALGYLNADQVFRMDETIGRVEVVRGGPSAVFYSNAPAGAINFISRGIADKPEGTAKLSISNHGQRRGDIWYSMPLSDTLGIGMGGFYRVDPGVRDPGFDANKGGQFRFKLVKDIDHGSITADFKHLDDQVEFYLGLPMRTYPDGSIKGVPGLDANYATIAGPQTQLSTMITGSGGKYAFDNSVGTQVKRDQFTLGFERDLSDGWVAKDSLRYSDTNTQRNGVYPNQLISISNFLTASAGLLTYVPGAVALDVRSVSAPGSSYVGNGNGLMIVGGERGITTPVTETVNDLRLSKKFKFDQQQHDVTLGYYYAGFDQVFQRYSSTVLLAAQSQAPLLNLVGLDAMGNVLGSVTDNGFYNYGYEWANAKGSSKTHSFYLSDDWKVNNQLSVDGGLRWERVNVSGSTEQTKVVNLGTFSTSVIQTGNGVFDTYDQTFSKAGWSIGSNYQLTRNSGVFARWSQAFRLPNLSSYITSPTATPRTQTMDLGEIGVKYTSEYLDLFPTFFYTKYNNVSYTNYVFSLNNSTSTPQTGYASTNTFGLELEGSVRFSKLFDLGLVVTTENPQYDNLTYIDKVNNLPVTRDFRNNQLIRVPRLNYRLTPGLNLLGDQLRLQATYEYVGMRFVDAANTMSLPSYNVINIAARYNLNKTTTLFFNVDNVNNSMGLTEGNPRAGELQSADARANSFIARPILGRNVRLAVKYDF